MFSTWTKLGPKRSNETSSPFSSRKGNHSEGELCGVIVEFIEQGSANCSLWAKSCCLAMFVNKVLFEHSCSYFDTTGVGFISCNNTPCRFYATYSQSFYKEIWGLVGLISPFVEPERFSIMTESVCPYCRTKSCIQSKQMYCKTLEKVLRVRGFLFLGGKRQPESKWNQSTGSERVSDTWNLLLFWAFHVFRRSYIAQRKGLSLSLPPLPFSFAQLVRAQVLLDHCRHHLGKASI